MELAVALAIGLIVGYLVGQNDTYAYLDKFYRDAWERKAQAYIDCINNIIKRHGMK